MYIKSTNGIHHDVEITGIVYLASCAQLSTPINTKVCWSLL